MRPGAGWWARPERYDERSRLRLLVDGVGREAMALAWRRRPAPPVRFVIYASGRTGSTLLTSSLDSHPRIRCADEILNRPLLDPVGYCDAHSRRDAAEAFGCHVKPEQHLMRLHGYDQPGSFLAALAGQGWRVVHLIRRDGLAHSISLQVARRTRIWHRRGEARDEPLPRFSLDVGETVRRVAKRQARIEAQRRAVAPFDPFRLSYEDDLLEPDRRQARLADLQRWLGIEVAPLSSPLRKSAPRDPWSLIENAEEVRAALAAAGLDGGVGAAPSAAPEQPERP
jgi:hypothetical protein